MYASFFAVITIINCLHLEQRLYGKKKKKPALLHEYWSNLFRLALIRTDKGFVWSAIMTFPPTLTLVSFLPMFKSNVFKLVVKGCIEALIKYYIITMQI